MSSSIPFQLDPHDDSVWKLISMIISCLDRTDIDTDVLHDQIRNLLKDLIRARSLYLEALDAIDCDHDLEKMGQNYQV